MKLSILSYIERVIVLHAANNSRGIGGGRGRGGGGARRGGALLVRVDAWPRYTAVAEAAGRRHHDGDRNGAVECRLLALDDVVAYCQTRQRHMLIS